MFSGKKRVKKEGENLKLILDLSCDISLEVLEPLNHIMHLSFSLPSLTSRRRHYLNIFEIEALLSC